MLQLLVVKTLITSICLAVRFGGGVFSPSLYLGAVTGAAFGVIATNVFPEVGSSAGLYALLGMGAVAAAVLGAPVSTVMIVFELTGGYALSIALLLTVSVATGVTQAFYGRSFFHDQLESRGVMITDGSHHLLMQTIRVMDVMVPLPEDAPEQQACFWPGSKVPYLKPSDTLETALKALDNSGANRIVVVDAGNSHQILGHCDHLRALRHYNRALVRTSIEEHH